MSENEKASANSGTGQSAPNLNYANALTPEIRALIKERFTYKQWNDQQLEHGKMVTTAAIAFAETIIEHVPPCPTRTRVLNLIEDGRMMANAAITHGGKF